MNEENNKSPILISKEILRLFGKYIIVLIDLDNIVMNIPPGIPVEKFSIKKAFENFFAWLRKIGEVKAVFVFGHENAISKNIQLFHEQGIFPVICPKVQEEIIVSGPGVRIPRARTDTTDATLIKLGELLIQIPVITHLCLASGDGDFLPLLIKAKKAGMEIMLTVSSFECLSTDLKNLADTSIATGKPMIHLFSPQTD